MITAEPGVSFGIWPVSRLMEHPAEERFTVGRSQRIVAIVKALLDNPASVLSLGEFAKDLDAAKSTLSEDIAVVREAFSAVRAGVVETVPGPAGGVRYLPSRSREDVKTLVSNLCEALSAPDRILPGEFVYMTDLVFSPAWAGAMGEVFATRFRSSQAQYVLTVETKGIAVALCTARCLGVPLAVCRRDSVPTEGPALSINFVSGSSRRIQTMSLPKRALARDSRVLIVDDFMKGGGTARGMTELVSEFGAAVAGIAVLIEMEYPQKKLVKDYFSLAVLHAVDEGQRSIDVRPSPKIDEI